MCDKVRINRDRGITRGPGGTWTHASRIVAVIILPVVLVGCSASQDARPGRGPSGSPKERKLTLAVIPKGTVHEFWKTVEQGVRQAASELEIDVKWEGPTNETEHDRQRSIVDNMVSLDVDGIALAPTDEKALVRPVKAATAQGIPVLIYDSELSAEQGKDYVSFVASDNEKGGRMAGEHMIQLLGSGGGRVIVLRYTEGSGSTLRREKGFLDTVQNAANIQVVDQQYTDGSTAGAQTTATNMLNRLVADGQLQLDGIFASNLATSLGMQSALDRLIKQGTKVSVKFIGFDASDKLLRGLEDGRLDALVVQNPRRMGYLAVETLVRHIRGESIQPYIDTGLELVTRDNLREPETRALLGLDVK